MHLAREWDEAFTESDSARMGLRRSLLHGRWIAKGLQNQYKARSSMEAKHGIYQERCSFSLQTEYKFPLSKPK
ncbi:hypothetical protein Naga_100007g22 [Nannochloropsis gaditana]|uniref:Uncharacterized protein n=1 Tax=Nannochloropsis gaditana TaxID=72520 RepID=W7TPX3_9STRA|nr:hypothetical protein Naga_100007g22 [Nannochloropsis gaditana]